MRRTLVTTFLFITSIAGYPLGTANAATTAAPVAATTTPIDSYVPITPTRIADTRPDTPNYGSTTVPQTPTTDGGTIRLKAAGRAGIPTDNAGVAINLTAVRTKTRGYLTVYACGSTKPTTSSLNLQVGNTVANVAFTKTDANGDICIYSRGVTDVIVDLNGYLPAGSQITLTDGIRFIDTRPNQATTGLPAAQKGPTKSGQEIRIPILGRGGIPADAGGVIVNITATESQTPGYLQVYPCRDRNPYDDWFTPLPQTSNLNLQPGNTVANTAFTNVGVDGKICVLAEGVTHVIIDINGYLPPADTDDPVVSSQRPVLNNARRLADTRPDTDPYDAPEVLKRPTSPGTVIRVPALQVANTGEFDVPGSATAAIVNVTAAQTKTGGYVTVYACDTAKPNSSNLNLQPGATVANMVVTQIGKSGDICVYAQGVTHVIVDLFGYVPTTSTCTIDGNVVTSQLSQEECDAIFVLYRASNPTAEQLAQFKRIDPCESLTPLCDTRFTKIVELNDLSFQIVGEIPSEIGDLTNLTKLTLLNHPDITKLPAEIGKLTNLTDLWLDDNAIGTLPPEIGQLAKLKTLEVARNKLTSLPPEIGQLKNLERLNAEENGITNLPPEIGNLTNLTDLLLLDNEITAIPPEIGNLTELEALYLGVNQIQTVPPQIGKLTKLTSLGLSYNRLTTIQPEISKLTKLEYLSLHNNLITGDVSTALAPFTTSANIQIFLEKNKCPTASNPKVKAMLDRLSPGWNVC